MLLSLGDIVYTDSPQLFGKCIAIVEGRYHIQAVHSFLNNEGKVVPDKDDVLPIQFIISKKGEHMKKRFKKYSDY
jgi:hypothetical protein